MKRNEELLMELNTYLDNIDSAIQSQVSKLYEAEFNALRDSIRHSFKVTIDGSHFEKNDVIKCIMKIINQINKEIDSLELEMHGVANYSQYENQRVMDVAFKQGIKNDLNKMLKMIVNARPERKESKLSSFTTAR